MMFAAEITGMIEDINSSDVPCTADGLPASMIPHLCDAIWEAVFEVIRETGSAEAAEEVLAEGLTRLSRKTGNPGERWMTPLFTDEDIERERASA
jgi:hypothetical protein